TVYTMMLAGSKDGKPPIGVMIIPSEQEITRVKIMNKSSKPVDIYLKEQKAIFASGLAAGADTGFVPVPSRAVTLQVRQAGSAPNSKEIAVISTQLLPERDITIVINPNMRMEITEQALTQKKPEIGATGESTAAATGTP